MKWSLRASLLLIFCPLYVFCQEYGYTHYDSKDGLAGSTVYCVVQDKDGFLWFGTEGGLSRFDGTHFKNFTKEDGLPDNEVLTLFADSKGRIWIAPFKKTVCYYYKGKIHTPDNDPVLQRIHVNDFVNHFEEDKAGNVLLQEPKKLHLVTANGQVTVIDTINSKPIGCINAISAHGEGGFAVLDRDRLYHYRNNRFRLQKTIPVFRNHFIYYAMKQGAMVWMYDTLTTRVMTPSGVVTDFPAKPNHLFYFIIDENHVGECTRDGAFIYNLHKRDSTRYFLPGVSVSGMLYDAEGSLWFSTLGHGIYKLSSPFVLNVKLRKNNQPSQVFALTPYQESILAGTEVRTIYRLNRKTGRPEKENINISLETTLNPVYAIKTYREKNILCGTGISLYKLGPDLKRHGELGHIVVKGLSLSGDRLYVATKDNVFIINPETMAVGDTIWHERSTAVFACHDTAYIGTLNGLYRSVPNRSTQFLGDKAPALKVRITAIQQDDAGVLWVGTYGDGLIGFKNDRVVATLTRHTGLSSNVCRTLYLCGDHLWVGTDKGINKINIAQPGYPVTQYTTGDGLASDIINAFIDGRFFPLPFSDTEDNDPYQQTGYCQK